MVQRCGGRKLDEIRGWSRLLGPPVYERKHPAERGGLCALVGRGNTRAGRVLDSAKMVAPAILLRENREDRDEPGTATTL